MSEANSNAQSNFYGDERHPIKKQLTFGETWFSRHRVRNNNSINKTILLYKVNPCHNSLGPLDIISGTPASEVPGSSSNYI
jgi:hypothetical protein